MKLRPKILLLLLPLITIPLLTVGSLAYVYLRDDSYRVLLNQMETSMGRVSDSLQTRINGARGNLELFAGSDLLRKHLDTPVELRYSVVQPYLIKQLGSYQNTFPEYYELQLILPDGQIDTRRARNDVPAGTHDDFIRDTVAQGLPRFEAFHWDSERGELDMMIARRIDHRAGTQGSGDEAGRGFLAMSVRMAELPGQMLEALSDEGADLYLVSPSGSIYLPAVASDETRRELIGKVLSSSGNSMRRYDLIEESFYAGVKKVHEKLFLIGVIREENLIASATQLRRVVIWTLGIVIFVSLVLVYTQLNIFLIRPINRLRQFAEGMSQGKMQLDDAEFSNDELADLARSFRRMSEKLQESHVEIKQLAYFDSLTGLPNRSSFNHALEKELSHAKRTGKSLALLIIDLDNFKLVNDVYGHKTGDALLKETAIRLQDSLRKADEIARQTFKQQTTWDEMLVRLGGDEFIVLLRDVTQAHIASLVATRINQALSEPYHINGLDIKLGASIGIALSPVDGEAPEQLIRSADLAMHEAKQRGKNNYQFFTSAMNEAVSRRLEIENDLRRAIRENEFSLYFQPKVDLRSGNANKFEGLIRWKHPERGFISPMQFIPVAEETGQIQDIGQLVLEMACQQMQQWKRGGRDNVQVAVNMSPLQLAAGDQAEEIQYMLKHYGLEGRNLEVEITESLLMRDEKRSIALLSEIRDLGVSIALDDFGSGYSSLAYLKRFPIDTIKIDRGFVIEMEKDRDSRLIIQAIVKLVQQLSLEVVVEGIETKGQLALVRGFDCDYAQGYYFSPAVPADTLQFDFRERLNA